MKNLKFLMFVSLFFVAFGIQAQKKLEQKAKKLTAEMTKVLELSKEESKAVYEIQFAKFVEAKKIKKEYADDNDQKKQELKKNGNLVFNKMKKLLGKERLKKWKQYKSTKNK